MAKRYKANKSAPALDPTKQVSGDSVTTRVFVGEVEYCQFPEALRRSGVGTQLGYSEGFQNFSGSAIYAYLRSHRNEFSSYIATPSGRLLFPYSELQEMISEYVSKQEPKETKVGAITPEVTELLEKLKSNPDLVKTILEIVA